MAEREYKRDEKGRFAAEDSKGAKEDKKGTARQRLLEVLKRRYAGQVLSKAEWARFYDRLGEIKRGAPVIKTKSGKKIIVLSGSFSDTVIMYKGGYVSPKVMSVKRVRYNDNEGLQDIIEYWKEYF